MSVTTHTLAKLDATHGADAVAPLGPVRVNADTGEIKQSAVVGTYLLHESQESQGVPPRYTGTVDVVSAVFSETKNTCALQTQSAVELPAVLDICPFSWAPAIGLDKATAIAACSNGTLYLLTSTAPFSTIEPHPFTTTKSHEGDLSLSVHVAERRVDDIMVACSNTAGLIGVYKLHDYDLSLLANQRMHDAEAWTAHIIQISNNAQSIVVSGGDDGVLTALDPRGIEPVWHVRNAHGGLGVTTLAWHSANPDTLWSGGYDDCIQTWDVRALRAPVSKRSLGVGGGVWRLRFHPRFANLILTAAMYEGCKVVRMQADQSLTVEASYKEHQSIAYGACWLSDLKPRNPLCALTASFYDRSVHLWALDS